MDTEIADGRTENTTPKRWHVTAFYGYDIRVYEIEEIEELQKIIEDGPDWRTLDKIEVRYQLGDGCAPSPLVTAEGVLGDAGNI